MTRNEKLLASIKAVLTPELKAEIALLNRKVKKALEQRDEWKAKATQYRKTILEKR